MITKQLPGGGEYRIYEPGDPPRPSHDADVCGACTFVANVDCIVVTPAQRTQAEVTPGRYFKALLGLYDLEETIIPLGRFTLPGWSGHNMFWLFTCPECQLTAVDYLHGNRLYLRCPFCSLDLSVKGERFYAESGLPKPPTLYEKWAWLRKQSPRKRI